VINLLSPDDARQMRDLFREAGYTEENLRQYFGAAELPSSRLRNVARLLDRTREPSPLNTLLRWFWIGESQSLAHVASILPDWFIARALSCGLLHEVDDKILPKAMILPIEEFLVASDHPFGLEAADAELVLWPNPTSKLLSRFTVRRPSKATLDLGTGSGILSLTAASFSDRIIATDLNPRAVMFAAFNARLNGIENVEFRAGDTFEPVAGKKFDLIFSNPPFFITPLNSYLFCDNPMDLDHLCRRLVREAPDYLNAGGYFQMLCEWAQIKGQTWQERVAEWFEGTGCDAWVIKGATLDPSEYAQHRIRETTSETGHDAELYEGYMAYYRDREVEAIHDGMIALRPRPGKNWVRVDEVSMTPNKPFGDLIQSTFAARDFLTDHDTDEKMLSSTLTLSPHVRLEQILEPHDGRWQPAALNLKLVEGFPFHLGLQPLVAEFLVTCDGKRTTGELIQEFATKADVPLDVVSKECLAMLRTLIERGFIL
jgi:methylase of polypeptide subunit release factors